MSNRFSQQGIAEQPELFDEDKNYIISFREAITLGFILSANCLAGGLLSVLTVFQSSGQ